jgi:hypothetical protein
MSLSLFDRTHRTFRSNRPRIALAAVMAAGMSLAGPAAQPTAAAPTLQVCAGNLLVNPSFDAGSYKTEGLGTSLSSSAGEGWTPWFVRGNDETWNREPEFKLNIPGLTGDAYRVRGGNSMKWFTTWATHDAGVWQRVNVPAGTTVTFSAHGMIYSGEADGHRPDLDTFFSDPEKNGSYRMQVGIDPYGNTPASMGAPPPDTVVWSAEEYTPDVFVEQAISTAARGGAVTVYTRGKAIWPVKHNDSFWEDTCLRRGGGAAAPAAVAAAPAEPAPVEPEAPAEPAAPVEPAAEVAASAPAPVAAEEPAEPEQAAAMSGHSRKARGSWATPR